MNLKKEFQENALPVIGLGIPVGGLGYAVMANSWPAVLLTVVSLGVYSYLRIKSADEPYTNHSESNDSVLPPENNQ